MKPESIQEAIDYVQSKRGHAHGFEEFKRLMEEAGNPQDEFLTVHVAGTDGKGSTVTFLRDLLMGQGYRVGTMQSPHFLTHLDRIRVNGENIKEEAFLRICQEKWSYFEEHQLSMFEIDQVIAYDYFKEENIDIAIIEVGLGGRLDFTNIIHHPLLSIITTIGYDHMDRLGNTLESICKEKCGIIKENCPVLIGQLDDSLLPIVQEIAEKKHSALYQIQEVQSCDLREFIYSGEHYRLSSLAFYQHHNASLALEAFYLLKDILHFQIDFEKVHESLLKSHWPGRFDLICDQPRIILDGAHNIHGVEALCESFDGLSGSKLILFSALKRKEYGKMWKMLKKHCDRLIIASFDYEGSIDLNEWKDQEKTDDYVQTIRLLMNDYENILICGSLYFISEVYQKKDQFLPSHSK